MLMWILNCDNMDIGKDTEVSKIKKEGWLKMIAPNVNSGGGFIYRK